MRWRTTDPLGAGADHAADDRGPRGRPAHRRGRAVRRAAQLAARRAGGLRATSRRRARRARRRRSRCRTRCRRSDGEPLTLLQVLGTDGQVVAASAQLSGTPALLAPSDRGRRVLDHVPGLAGEQSWLAEPTPATIGGRSVLLIVLTSLASYERGVALVRNALLVTVPVLVALVALLVWWVVGRALRPVETMRREVARITAERLDRRVRQPPGDGRDRTAGGHAQRHARPAAVVERRATALRRRRVPRAAHADRQHPSRRRGRQRPSRSGRLAGRGHGRPAAGRAHGAAHRGPVAAGPHRSARRRTAVADGSPSTSPSSCALELARPLPEGRRLIAGRISAAVVAGDRGQLAQVLTNLVDNALRHARRRRHRRRRPRHDVGRAARRRRRSRHPAGRSRRRLRTVRAARRPPHPQRRRLRPRPGDRARHRRRARRHGPDRRQRSGRGRRRPPAGVVADPRAGASQAPHRTRSVPSAAWLLVTRSPVAGLRRARPPGDRRDRRRTQPPQRQRLAAQPAAAHTRRAAGQGAHRTGRRPVRARRS